MEESQDIGRLLVRAVDLLRTHQETLFKNTLATTAAVEALRQTNPAFAATYDKQFWDLK